LVAQPPPGCYQTEPSVTLTTATEHVEIRYVIDGGVPGPASALYTGPITVDRGMTITAIALRAGFLPSPFLSATYKLHVAAPIITPNGGDFDNDVAVTLASATPGATIRISLDGSEPTESSFAVTGEVIVDHSATLRAKAFRSGWISSPAVSAQFNLQVVTPELTPAPGSFLTQVSVSAESATSGATLRYSTNGVPTETSPILPANLTLTQTATVTVVGFKAGYAPSEPASATYTVIPIDDLPVPEVSYYAYTPTTADLYGEAPGSFSIVGLQIAVVSPTAAVAIGDIEGSLFHGHLTHSNEPGVVLDLAFIDDQGHVGPVSTATLNFVGGTGSNGDPSQLPPATPKVTLEITGGLTGDVKDAATGLHFTNNTSVSVLVSAECDFGGISSIELISSDGTVMPQTGNNLKEFSQSFSLPVTEGTWELTARAIVTNNSASAVGETPTPVGNVGQASIE
jgi:hypothetical protein